ncbi:epsilon-sarcoglycan isoform X1 [Zophobas morio]|uniref:epsilon-sarcoglycan isoform X1 n=1 Tax=Zophobas morio TaxID=2755281 RepID=UPI003082C014
MLFYVLISSLSAAFAKDENVLMTEVFEIVVNPPMFNWTYEGKPDQFVYQPSLLNAPDLPSWINYIFSREHHCGFLFGVPPNENNAKIQLEVIALNRKNYETRHEHINIHVSEKLNPAKYQVHIKIDNLDVDNMFEVERMESLKDIFRKVLWKDSQSDLYVTFLSSAITLGARKPLNPSEGEGVVLRLGSQAPFSSELTELQEEVRPLWKTYPCPRDFKRTKVERLFRNSGFHMDWCSFRLVDDNNSLHQAGTNEKLLNSVENDYEDKWETVMKSEVPQRSYLHEFLFTILVPMFVMILLALVLSIILCFHHEGIKDPESEVFFYNLYHICIDYYRSKRLEDAPSTEINQYATIHRATQSLRSLSNNREMTLSPDPMLLSRSHTNSPQSTINRGVHCRPNPPPYVRPKFKPDL